MKKLLIATAALSLVCGPAFAQSTGPAPQQDNMTKPGMTKGSMEKETTGMNNNGLKKDPNAMPNQDATSHGTVGPGSDTGAMKK
jgi:pentapeptide MXKDX repeat protein